jgi:hypothetical protein
MDCSTEDHVRAAIDKLLTFSCPFFFKGIELKQDTMIISEGGTLADWDHIKSEIRKYMEENGVQLRADSGNAARCKGGVHLKAPSAESCVIHYRGLYCACKTKIWKQPKDRKRSRRSKRSARDCKACIRFQFNGVCWKVNKVVTTHDGHCLVMPKGSTKLTEADKSELKDLIISDRSSISTAISNFMRIKDIALTSQDVRNVINGWENRCLSGLELQIGGTIGVSAQGQFAALIHNLSFDPNLVVFIHYKVKDSSNCVISSFNQIYFNIGNERKNVFLKGNSINFNVFKLIFQEQECTVHENEGLEEMDISQGNFMPMTVSWCSLDQLQRNSRYCEVVMLDATGGTNSQKRPVVMIVSMDGEMKNTCLLTTITVDETSSSFMRILQAFRMIYGRDVCNRIKTFFSDGDEQITGSIDSNISRGSFSSDTKRFLCTWHAVNLKLQKETCHFKEEDLLFRKAFKKHVHHALHYCENYEEFSHVIRCTQELVESSTLSADKKEILCNFNKKRVSSLIVTQS